MTKNEKIMKGDNYYNDLKTKVDKLVKCRSDWVIKRSDEKNALIKSLYGSLGKSPIPKIIHKPIQKKDFSIQFDHNILYNSYFLYSSLLYW